MRLRMQAGLGGRPLAEKIDSTQATVSRIERGQTLPSLPIVRAWLKACGADPETTTRVVSLAEAVHTYTRGWAALLDEHGHAQREFRAREVASRRVRNFQPSVVPGLLQTPEYARAAFSMGRTRDVDAAVAERIARQTILYEEGRRFEFILAEQVLHIPYGGPEVLAAQRDRLVSLARLPTVELVVLPTSPVVMALWSNFIIWDPKEDPPYGASETWLGETKVEDPGEVAWLEEVWSRLWDASVQGDAALDLIRRRWE